MKQFMRKVLYYCESTMTYLAVASTFIMMCLTTADALGRYVFNWPITGAYEITEKYLMTMTIFLGFSYAYREGFLIRVTFLVDRLPGQVIKVVNHLVQVIAILYGAILVVTTMKRTFQTLSSGDMLGNVHIPLWPAYLMVPVGLFFMTLLMLLDLPQVRKGKSHLFKEESPTT
jgi:TRAP-type C4-dicarboxylate transport system permease small subunit